MLTPVTTLDAHSHLPRWVISTVCVYSYHNTWCSHTWCSQPPPMAGTTDSIITPHFTDEKTDYQHGDLNSDLPSLKPEWLLNPLFLQSEIMEVPLLPQHILSTPDTLLCCSSKSTLFCPLSNNLILSVCMRRCLTLTQRSAMGSQV